ncbi:hypothetical protein M413DRAFT_30674 [Hebeloma cylindrosporum]|uniref:F-box domain-containing protein n=1 Tax=Hebeloma cylindrosporum TaxID=76867 RepID=A0A0C2Y9P7_HEBCY|nr:hypothetical protein M413DRAFT_30674 [Hebeloma cylindrosporum h7]
MDAFPLELLHLIVAFTGRKDLPSLARTCSALLNPSRQELYRQVTLRSDAHLKYTLSLLMREDISKRVIELHILGFSPFIQPNGPASFEMMKGLRNLATLSIQNCPATFSTVADQGVFQQVLTTYCPSLKNIRVVKSGFIGSQLLLGGLQNIIWEEDQGPFSSLALSLLSSSISTLTHLSVPSASTGDTTHIMSFCSLRFPQLSVLVIEPWVEDELTSVHSLVAGFNQFLSEHSSIYHLELGCCDLGCCLIELDDAYMTEEFLPELRTFKGHVRNIEKLASGRCQSLTKVKTLIAGWFDDDFFPEDFSDILDRDGVFSVLEEFVFKTSEVLEGEPEPFLEWMECLANASPLLRVWRGSLPPTMSLNLLIQVFSRFRNIREIEIFSWTVPEPDQETLKIDAARAVAAHCRYLQSFYFRDAAGIPKVMNFVRDHEVNGAISSSILSTVEE